MPVPVCKFCGKEGTPAEHGGACLHAASEAAKNRAPAPTPPPAYLPTVERPMHARLRIVRNPDNGTTCLAIDSIDLSPKGADWCGVTAFDAQGEVVVFSMLREVWYASPHAECLVALAPRPKMRRRR